MELQRQSEDKAIGGVGGTGETGVKQLSVMGVGSWRAMEKRAKSVWRSGAMPWEGETRLLMGCLGENA